MGQTTSAENSREANFGNDENNITTLCDLIAELSVSDEKKYKAPSHISRNVTVKTTSEDDKSPFSHRQHTDSTSEIMKTTFIKREYANDSSPYVSYSAAAKTSFEENTPPLLHRSYFNSSPELVEAISKEKEKEYTTTTPLPYRTYVDSTSELMKTFSEEKDNAGSFLHRPYISRKAAYIEQKIQKTPLKSYESQISHYVKKKYIDEIVTEIVRYLAKKDNYEVYGYWVCKPGRCIHIPRCQDKLQCECSEMELPYTRELLEEYLETPERLCDLFRQNCVKCGRRNLLISSFRLYMKENFNKNYTTEIICHLEWENHYRVFGSWKCSHCRKRWKSAYTWISLRKFLEQTPGMFLNQEDYMMQKCKRCEGCRRCNNDQNIIFSYEPLVLSRDGADHKMELCAKCNYYGVKCIELETYYGMKHG